MFGTQSRADHPCRRTHREHGRPLGLGQQLDGALLAGPHEVRVAAAGGAAAAGVTVLLQLVLVGCAARQEVLHAALEVRASEPGQLIQGP